MFWLKKALSPLVLPLQLSLLAGVIGVYLLWRRRRERTGKLLVTLAMLVLVIASNKQAGRAFIAPLEQHYPALPDFADASQLPPRLAACRYVVVLGGGHGDVDELSSVNKLSTAAISRLAEGIRLWRLLPDAKLVTTGHGNPGRPDHSEILARAAVSLGVPRERILQVNQARDTEEEAVGLKHMLGDAPFVLVTSATHLPRAVALCKRQGLDPLPAPADFLIKSEAFQPGDLGWDISGLERTTRGVYERIGLLWSRLRGHV
jgi:uncharacterized SAM-binding protein YcdF (DUF218 family)